MAGRPDLGGVPAVGYPGAACGTFDGVNQSDYLQPFLRRAQVRYVIFEHRLVLQQIGLIAARLEMPHIAIDIQAARDKVRPEACVCRY